MSSPLTISARATSAASTPPSGPADPAPDDATSAELHRAQENAVVEMLDVPAVVDELAARFAERGHLLYLVGGSVRDALLHRSGR